MQTRTAKTTGGVGVGGYRLNQKSTETETKDKQKSALFPQLYLHKRGPLIHTGLVKFYPHSWQMLKMCSA